MDDTRIQVEFPVGDSGHTFLVSQPTEGQMLALALSRQPTDGNSSDMPKLVRRIFHVVEKIMGPAQWETLEYRLIDGEYDVTEVMDFVQQIVTFDWSSITPAQEPEALEETKSPRPSPRVVGRG